MWFLKHSIPSKGFFYIGNNAGQCTTPDFKRSCKRISERPFFFCCSSAFEHIYTMWTCQTYKWITRVTAFLPIPSLFYNTAVLRNREIILETRTGSSAQKVSERRPKKHVCLSTKPRSRKVLLEVTKKLVCFFLASGRVKNHTIFKASPETIENLKTPSRKGAQAFNT